MILALAGVGLILAAVAAALLLQRRPVAGGIAFRALFIAGSAALGWTAIAMLRSGTPRLVEVHPALPTGPWVIGLDPLSAWFLLALAMAAPLVAVYGGAYLSSDAAHRPVGRAHAWLAALVAGMALVFLAQAAIPFLIAWEAMAIAAYMLIVFHHDDADVRRAGLVYLALTHVGALALITMFLAWGAGAPDLRFASLAAASPELPYGGAIVLLLALLGFGIKAGVFPLHVWLPGAHAAAPSHASAILSGVMIKTGIYGIMRVVQLIGAPPRWYGLLLLVLGVASAVLGAFWALSHHDLKRVLAYSSIENVGLILLALGAGMLGAAAGAPAVAVLGYAAALIHTLNHALFKSLLFMVAGAVARATGTRQLDRLGGLARRMPRTALLLVIGVLAITGLPPLNGFVSEWLLVQGLLAAGTIPSGLRFLVVVVAPIGLVAALALAAFARIAGIAFCGSGRAPSSSTARDEGEAGMLIPMAFAALACLVIGLAPGLVLGPASAVAAFAGAGGTVAVPVPPALPLTAAWIALAAVAALFALLARRRRTAEAATWACAYPEPTPRMQYTASSFSAPLLAAGPRLVAPRTQRTAGSFRSEPVDRLYERAVVLLWARVKTAAAAARPLQQGRVTSYLRLIVITLIAMLALLLLSEPAS